MKNLKPFESAFKKDLELLRSDMLGTLRTEIKESKVDMIKWFFAFFIAITLMIAGLYFKK